MRKGFQVARMFGISIEVDWSWLLIFLLVTWNLSSSFTDTHPDWGRELSWAVGVAAALLLFISVLLHELAHSLVAKARGLPVRRIVLFLFGGVSNIEREPPSPGVEFWVAVVGPITSIVLGVVLLVAGGAAAPVSEMISDPAGLAAQLTPLATLLLWLGSVNLFLGAFNLLPGFPLDGGRILRSIFWGASGNLRKATRWASWFGQGIAWLMIVAGFAMAFGVQIPFFGTGFVSGLWLVFIGWFLNTNAITSYRQVVIQDLLEDVPVRRIMRPDPPTVSPSLSIDQLIDEGLMGTDDHGFPVVEGGRLIGMVTLEDIRKIPRSDWGSSRVADIMTPAEDLESVAPDEEASDALNKLRTRDVRQLPVLEDGELAGLLRRRDIVRWLQLQADL